MSLDLIDADPALFARPAFSLDSTFFFKSPEFKVSQTFFLEAFTFEFWMASLGITLLIVACGWIFYRYVIKKDSITQAIFIGIFVFSGQGEFSTSSRSSWKFYSVVVGLFSFMFLSAFDMFMSSLLSAQRADLPFTDIDGIAESEYSLCIDDRIDLYRHFALQDKFNGTLNDKRCPEAETMYNIQNMFEYTYKNDRTVLAIIKMDKRQVLQQFQCLEVTK